MSSRRLLRARRDDGFTLIELLVVILIIGILAAIAIPSFLAQQDKANDTEAKSAAATAARAFEACRTATAGGSYAGCTVDDLREIEPALNDAGSRLEVDSTPNTYEVRITANRDAGAVVYSISRATNGTRTRSCETGSAEKGGCSAQSGGTW
jgi:type IV pilus assembly protein PilA